jgi:hypothetical protein
METIEVSKEMYDYSFCKLYFHINNAVGEIKKMHYWVSKDSAIHYIVLRGSVRALSVTLRFANKFAIPDENTLRHGRRWHLIAPKKYDVSTFIYGLLYFTQEGKRPATPVKTLIGISPKKEKSMEHQYRSRVKKLMQSLTRDVKNGVMDFDSAAGHFSFSTGYPAESSLRYFRRHSF